MLLKGNLAQKLWPIDAAVGADWRGRGSDSLGRHRGSRIGGELALISPSKESRSCRNRATIVRRSWSWFSIDCRPIQWKDCGIDSAMREAMITLDHGHDRTTIGPRLRHDWATMASRSGLDLSAVRWRSRPDEDLTRQRAPCIAHLMEIGRSRELHASPRWDEDRGGSWPSDGDQMITTCPRGAPRSRNRKRSRPSDEATCDCNMFDLMKIGRSSQRHVSSGTPFDRRHFKYILRTCLIWWSRGLGFTRSPPSRPNPTLVVRPCRLQKVRHVWDIVPHGRNI